MYIGHFWERRNSTYNDTKTSTHEPMEWGHGNLQVQVPLSWLQDERLPRLERIDAIILQRVLSTLGMNFSCSFKLTPAMEVCNRPSNIYEYKGIVAAMGRPVATT